MDGESPSVSPSEQSRLALLAHRLAVFHLSLLQPQPDPGFLLASLQRALISRDSELSSSGPTQVEWDARHRLYLPAVTQESVKDYPSWA